jgi:hypothetical protein
LPETALDKTIAVGLDLTIPTGLSHRDLNQTPPRPPIPFSAYPPAAKTPSHPNRGGQPGPYLGFQPIPAHRIGWQPTYASEINLNNQTGGGQHPISEQHGIESSAKGSTGETPSGRSTPYHPLPFYPSHLTLEFSRLRVSEDTHNHQNDRGPSYFNKNQD